MIVFAANSGSQRNNSNVLTPIWDCWGTTCSTRKRFASFFLGRRLLWKTPAAVLQFHRHYHLHNYNNDSNTATATATTTTRTTTKKRRNYTIVTIDSLSTDQFNKHTTTIKTTTTTTTTTTTSKSQSPIAIESSCSQNWEAMQATRQAPTKNPPTSLRNKHP